MPPGQARVVARAAGDEIDAGDVLRELGIQPELGGHHIAGLELDAPPQRVFDGARLLEDLLEHEVLVAAFFRLNGAPVDGLDWAFDGLAVQRLNRRSLRSQLRQLAIFQDEHPARVAEQGWNVGRAERLPVAEADDHRRALLGDHEARGQSLARYDQAVRTANPTQCTANRLQERVLAVG